MGVENCYLLIYYKSDNDSFSEGWNETRESELNESLGVGRATHWSEGLDDSIFSHAMAVDGPALDVA
jgi:hypothetical protein